MPNGSFPHRMPALPRFLTRHTDGNRSPLASKLLRTVLSIYLLAAFCVTCFQLVLEYREEERRLRLEVDQVAEAFLPALAPALWNMDHEQVRGTSEGMWVNPAIWRLTVRDDLGETIAERAREVEGFASGWSLPWYEYVYEICFTDSSGRDNPVGRLTLASNAYVVARRATGTFLFTVANAALKTLILWLIFYYVLVRVVARPLSVLTRAIRHINPDSSSVPRTQERNLSVLHTDDELGEVAVSVNQLEGALIEKNKAIADRQRHLERTVDELERASAAKSEFLAHMSHELRTPLNGMIGMTELLATTPLNHEQNEHLAVLGSASRQLLGVINNVLDFSKIESGRLELEQVPFDLERLVADCVALAQGAAAGKGLQLNSMVRGDGEAHVVGDPTRLRQVLDNLVNNAVKFTARGSVTVTVDVVRVETRRRVRFEVADTGIGITRQQREHLFESFRQGDQSTTRRFGGTGLGLAISQQLVALMGGEVELVSEPGKGAAFSFEVVLEAADTGAQVPEDEPLPAEQYPGLRVLVAEDNQVNQRVVKGMLQRFGVRADIAGDGAQALQRCEAPGAAFDLVFMDIDMPVLDGWSATRALREGPAANRVGMIVGLSAHALDVDREKAGACGMDGYVAKPMRMQELGNILHRAHAAAAAR